MATWKRLPQECAGEYFFSGPGTAWLVYDGRRWKRDDSGEIMRRAKETVRSMQRQALADVDSGDRARLVKHALQSERAVRLEAMIMLARSEPGIPVLPDGLDAGDLLFNVENGTLDLRTGTSASSYNEHA